MQLGRRRKARVSVDSESIFYGVTHCVRHSSIWAPGLIRKIEELYVGQRSLLIFSRQEDSTHAHTCEVGIL